MRLRWTFKPLIQTVDLLATTSPLSFKNKVFILSFLPFCWPTTPTHIYEPLIELMHRLMIACFNCLFFVILPVLSSFFYRFFPDAAVSDRFIPDDCITQRTETSTLEIIGSTDHSSGNAQTIESINISFNKGKHYANTTLFSHTQNRDLCIDGIISLSVQSH